MISKPETILPRGAMPETVNLFDIVEKIPPEKKAGFFEFLRGFNYGLDMAGALSESSQASA